VNYEACQEEYNMLIAPSEKNMWEKQSSGIHIFQMNDDELNIKYERGQRRILTKINRQKIPSFLQELKNPGYMDINPYYQRRIRWDERKKSRLIESFLINIPVPPIILYEKNYNSYEVIDGQQRISSIREFYENKLKLTDLEIWPELNGLTYNQLPVKLRAGINRRSISSIALMTESILESEEAFFLKKIAFERLNTGGAALSRQEVRNSVYSSNFNKLLIELASNRVFVHAWDIPIDQPNELIKNNIYQIMEDVELILSFFALRHVEDFDGEMEAFLDTYMFKSLNFSNEDIQVLKEIFIKTIELAHAVYKEHLFKPFDAESNTWKDNACKVYYDAVMVGLSRHLQEADILIERQSRIIEETKELFREDTSKLFIGGGTSKANIQKSIQLFDNMLSRVVIG
jgi:Protein of unknown function DUF262